MHLRGQPERHFAVKMTHQKNYQYLSQASEDGVLHGCVRCLSNIFPIYSRASG